MTLAVMLTIVGLVSSLVGAAIAAGIVWGKMHGRVERAETSAAHTAATIVDAARQLALLLQQVQEQAKDLEQLTSLVRETDVRLGNLAREIDVRLGGKVDDLRKGHQETALRIVHLERSVDAIADHTGAPGVPRHVAADHTPIRGVRG